ncbi:MAG: NfeD family protein [Clostridiales bacterium]|nr:NfeD family protein [Clostridiales bacterium]
MLELLAANMILFWIACAVIFAVLEGFVSGLLTIWFTIGGAAAAAAAAMGAPIPVQIVAFFAVSIVLLVFTRPILIKRLKVGREKNYTEQLEGKPGLVVEEIKPFDSGQVKVNGIVWTAIGEAPEFSAKKGDRVEIIKVEGVKLIVKEEKNHV